MLAELINKPSTRTTVQQKAVNIGKSLPSAPVAQLAGNDLANGENSVKQLKSAPSFPPIQLMSNSSKGVVQKLDDFEMDKVFDGPKSTFQQENPMLVAKRAAAEKAAFSVKPDNLDDITMDKVHGMGKSSVFKQENPMLAAKKAAPIAEAVEHIASNSSTSESINDITNSKVPELSKSTFRQENPMLSPKKAATVPDDGLYSLKDKKKHDLFTKASKVITGKANPNEFYEQNPAYGMFNKEFEYDPNGEKTFDPKAEVPVGRLAGMYMHKPDPGKLKLAYHVAATERGAKSAAAQIDGGWHNEDGRFGGGFHVASDIATGAMEVDHHQFDAKKKAKKEALEAGKSEAEQEAAYAKADLIQPTNYLTYNVNLGAGDIIDATGPLTAMVMSKPKEIELAARQDNKDGILYKSSRGSGLALVLYKNYNSILKLLYKQVATTKPDKFGEAHIAKREEMRNAEADEEDIKRDRNPTNKISNKLIEAKAEADAIAANRR